MKLNFIPTETVYTIEIPIDLFRKHLLTCAYDHDVHKDGNLGDKIEKLDGVREVDYDGHFGSYIFIRIEKEYDGLELKNQIKKIIREHLTSELQEVE